MVPAQTVENISTAPLTSSLPRPLQKFYKGEPNALGVTQIMTGVIHILLGIILTASISSYYPPSIVITGYPFWSGILYIISGSLSVATSCNPNLRLVRGSLGMNIVSSVAAGIGIIILSLIKTIDYRSSYYCDHEEDEDNSACRNLFYFQETMYSGIIIVLLVFTILEFCISISTSIFACKAICRTAYSEVNVVIYQNTSPCPVANDLSSSLPAYEEVKCH